MYLKQPTKFLNIYRTKATDIEQNQKDILIHIRVSHCVKYYNFTYFSDVAILWKGTSKEFGKTPKILQKLCLSANFHTRKLGGIMLFYAVSGEIYLRRVFMTVSMPKM